MHSISSGDCAQNVANSKNTKRSIFIIVFSDKKIIKLQVSTFFFVIMNVKFNGDDGSLMFNVVVLFDLLHFLE